MMAFALSMLGKVTGLPWKKIGQVSLVPILIMSAAFWFFIWPLQGELSAMTDDRDALSVSLLAKTQDLVIAQRQITAEISARDEANLIIHQRSIENATLARALDEVRALGLAATNQIASNARRSTRNADIDWSNRPVPQSVSISLCLGLAAIANSRDGIHHPDCGGVTDDERGTGR